VDEREQLCVAFLLSESYDWDYSMENRDGVILYASESLEDVAYALVEDGCFGTVGDGLVNYIDYDAIARDLSYDGYVQTDEGVFCYTG
jgi:antirestriction protein